jgi:FtsH-binding integral membrane protein
VNTTTAPKASRSRQFVLYSALIAMLAWTVFLFFTGDHWNAIQMLCIFVLAVSGAMSYSSAYRKDSWSRIVAVGVFIVAAAILVSVLVISAFK